MKKLAVALALSTLAIRVFAATPPKLNEALLRSSFVNLKDPDSAKFRNITYFQKPGDSGSVWEMCGEVNAKNSYGGYIGFSRFNGSVVSNGKKPPFYMVLAIGELADQLCAKSGL